jgi:hypothetical protein
MCELTMADNGYTVKSPHARRRWSRVEVRAHCKAALADVGLYALTRGEWQMVMAITRMIQERGWSRE